ncbi:MAG: winged helix DNA-binding domain-containing protein, partial [bacterium]|nr:winged helix DNA-binding domain-containing protein [bacterium]
MSEAISLQSARQLLLVCQGLQSPLKRVARKADVLAAIRRMQLLQIDTISVVARSPYLVLYSRVGAYEQRWLDELLAEGELFEYWAHAACFIPAGDYPLYGSVIDQNAQWNVKRWVDWASKHKREVEHVRKRIKAEGGLKSSDFQNETKRGTWWDWKVEKIALEYLLVTGELMIARRDKFQRVYDLRERVLPGWDQSQVLPLDEVIRRKVSNSALALGVATEPWLRDYYRLHYQKDARIAISELLDSGELLEVRIESIKAPAYLHREYLPLFRRAAGGKLKATVTVLLSPFDPVVWHRARAAALFGFDYLIECYTLEHKRRYGYFTLPILHKGALVGRLDPKAHRKDRVFEVKSLHLEPGVKLDDGDWAQLAAAIKACAEWHGTPVVRVGKTEPSGTAKSLRAALK